MTAPRTIGFDEHELTDMTAAKRNGFTLVELLIVMLLSGIVITAIYSAFLSQQNSYVAQDQVAEMQQNLRASMGMMTREIRMAGCDPTGSANAGFVTATGSLLNFTQDLNGDGDWSDANENVTFGFSNADDADADGIVDSAALLAGAAILRRNTGGGLQPIAYNISAIEFYYTLADGTKTLTPVNLDNIRAVQVSILARAANPAQNFTHMESYTTPSGAIWMPPNDNYRRRFLTTTVQCRNMGLK